MIVRKMFGSPRGWRSPFDELEEMKRRMERLSQALTGDIPRKGWPGVYPLINVTETNEIYRVRAELPGVRADALAISITGKSLALTGERKIPAEGEEAKYHRRERESGKFSRIIELPDPVDAEKVDANMVNGVLTITLPKSESVRPRQIKVN
ncbi:heat-shock protein Hsp20 [Desulfonema ishimotonii]|uniref:Heat-shock protein Hsp20 n=1 Tax=Desulfonema ishimotonii TaxID=45657 RepID=A0A401FZG2_9BACT|nr:Hsp20/alpha crystallin family protein [Desulfonema ishimotonii]GBC62348.1 heat-shock protein Hsp20 [Desulfonema ishimotonii]